MTPAVRDLILSNRVAWSFMGDGSHVWDFTRASGGTRVNSAASWETVSANGLRYDYDLTTGSLRGALVEPARENTLTNGIGQGGTAGVIGAGGAFPTGWGIQAIGNAGTLNFEIIGTTVDSGIDCVDVRFFGTPTGSGYFDIKLGNILETPALTGQRWVASLFINRVGGTTANTGLIYIAINEFTSGGAFVTNGATLISAENATTALARKSFSRILTGGATTAFASPFVTINYASGAVDITFRFGWIGFERAVSGVTGYTSPIRTAGAAVTRAVDALSLPVPPGVYSVEVIGGSVLLAGTRYTDTVAVTGAGWSFAWPAAAVTAGERHLQRVSMRRIG